MAPRRRRTEDGFISSATPMPPDGPNPPSGSDAGGTPQGGTPPERGPGASRPASGPDRLFAWLRDLGLRRNTSDKWLAGVCSGIAERLGVDPIVIRAVVLALFLFGGIGLIPLCPRLGVHPEPRGAHPGRRGTARRPRRDHPARRHCALARR